MSSAARLFPALLGLVVFAVPSTGRCWGDEGHEVVGIIAEHYLDPTVRERVANLLAGELSGLVRTTSIANESTWADKYRDSDRNTTAIRYLRTRSWHYVDIELDHPNLDSACHSHPSLAPGVAASDGPPDNCIVDKIEQFRRELRDPTAAPDERRLALLFLLHFVGDIHQPLHASDNHDKGGNDLMVSGATAPPGTLHHYWDTVVVERLGGDPEVVGARLVADLSQRKRRAMSRGNAADWARESFRVGRVHAYGRLPGAATHRRGSTLDLDGAYETDARSIVASQLQRAGVRLARVLNQALR